MPSNLPEHLWNDCYCLSKREAMTGRKLGILANLEKSGIGKICDRISAWSRRAGFEIASNSDIAGSSPDLSANPFGVSDQKLLEQHYAGTEILITLGGDGTLLYAAQLVAAPQIPVLSVNLGSLGFHTQVSPHNLDECLAVIEAGAYPIENRMLLRAEMPGGSPSSRDVIAMNDLVVAKSAWGHMVTLHVTINNEVVSDIAADAIIVSSPTGSSAYNYAAGGPILFPDMDALILNALCTHRMRVSPLVVPGDSVIEVTLRPRRPGDSAQILNDGQPWRTISEKETLKISRAPMYLPLIVFENDFYGKLRNKLRWGGLF